MWLATIMFVYLNGAGMEKELVLNSKTEFKSQKECIMNASKTVNDMIRVTTDTVLVASFACSRTNSA